MDVIFGHCWRCEKAIEQEVKCGTCNKPKYCSERCCHRDQWRHKPECDEWKPRTCSNPKCSNGSGTSLKEVCQLNSYSFTPYLTRKLLQLPP